MKPEEIKDKTLNLDFESVYIRHSSTVMHFASRYILNKEDARNIMHDVFVAFLESAGHFDTNRNPLPYLLTITKNKCINLLRKNVHSRDFSTCTIEQKKEYLNLIALENECNSNIYNTEVKDLLKNALDKMPPKVRHTFIMVRVRGYTNEETARQLEISTRGVEERMKKAMLILRKIFKDYL